MKPWKWAAREIGGKGPWTCTDTREEAILRAREMTEDGYPSEVVGLWAIGPEEKTDVHQTDVG